MALNPQFWTEHIHDMEDSEYRDAFIACWTARDDFDEVFNSLHEAFIRGDLDGCADILHGEARKRAAQRYAHILSLREVPHDD